MERVKTAVLRQRWIFPALTTLLVTAVLACILVAFLHPERPGQGRTFKYILQWNTRFHLSDSEFPHFGLENFTRLRCARCLTTNNHFLKAPEEYDAVLVDMCSVTWQSLSLPPESRPQQRYVFFRMEAPSTCTSSHYGFGGLFHWTMSYHLDADVVAPYGEVVPLIGARAPARARKGWLAAPAEPIVPSDALDLSGESEIEERPLVASLVSHCRTQSRREDYVRELAKHIRVDEYGACGPHPWPAAHPELLLGTRRFYRKFSNYTFYLSFEDLLCRDYVTERFFLALELGVVPVVYGAANYSAIAPPLSYIDARGFASPRHLARYLQWLARHPEELDKFRWWKRHYRAVTTTAGDALCRLCDRLHRELPGPAPAFVDRRWWRRHDACQEPRFQWSNAGNSTA